MFKGVPAAVWVTVLGQAVLVIFWLGRLDSRLDHQERRLQAVIDHMTAKLP